MSYPRSDFFRSVLHLGKQIYQIRYFLAFSDRQTRGSEAAGLGGGGGHHSASTRGAGLQPNSTCFKNGRALSFETGRLTRPSLPGQLLPDCPLEGARVGESPGIQGTGELLHSPNTSQPASQPPTPRQQRLPQLAALANSSASSASHTSVSRFQSLKRILYTSDRTPRCCCSPHHSRFHCLCDIQ